MANVKKVLKYSSFLLFIGSFIFVLLNPVQVRYSVLDWYRRGNFEPTQEIKTITDRIQLTETGRDLFFATQPQLITPSEFSNFCPATEESNVLGCYSNDLTYILNVEEAVLERVEDVTAVHELLHGVWARLDSSEQQELGNKLTTIFEQSNDVRLIDLVQSYRSSDSGNDPLFIANELHSILGTEVIDLSPELEEHYSKYLVDRLYIVELFNSYNGEFERREDRIEELQKNMNRLKTQIEQLNSDIDSLNTQNDQLVSRINSLRSQGQVQESNQLVPQQNSLVAQIRNKVLSVNDLIEEFNSNVEENNDLALELNQLVDSLDSRASQ